MQSRPELSRRTFTKATALTTGAFFINSTLPRAWARLEDSASGGPPSPATTPFLWPLAFAPIARPLDTAVPLLPAPIPALHQRYAEFAPEHFYEMRVREVLARPHPQLAASPFSTYGGSAPGLTFVARYGMPMLVRFLNELPATMPGFGSPDISTHLHNGHQAPESDGHPDDFHPPGTYRDHHWPNMYAGGDWCEAKGTLWYHDHRIDYTAQNTYRGLAGFYLLFDNLDSGSETDPNPDAWRVPSGVPDGANTAGCHDIPLVLTDRRFDASGRLVMDVMDMDGLVGDKFLVNGRVQPYFNVERRKYRFRILDGGPSRFYDLCFSNGMTFHAIATDGNALPVPVELNRFKLAVAERIDIIVDFSKLPESTTELYLVNRAEHRDGRRPEADPLPMATAPRILKFNVLPGQVPDPSRIPTSLRPLPAMDPVIAQRREFRWTRSNGIWTVNGQVYDPGRVDLRVRQGQAEVWTFRTSGGWAHPIHAHLEEGRMLDLNGQPLGNPLHRGRKDVYTLYAGEEMRVYLKFRDFLGRYPMHCHNTIHEDHSMMVQFEVVP